jgi:hypothetical protein
LLAREGGAVLGADLDEPEAAGTAEIMQAAGGTAIFHAFDVTSELGWDAAIELVERRWGRLHVLVNCAGIDLVRPVTDTTLPDWRRGQTKSDESPVAPGVGRGSIKGMGFIEWWADLPAPLRYGTAVIFLGVSTFLWFLGRFWPWGWVVGIVLLLMAGPSKAEKKGYHDF